MGTTPILFLPYYFLNSAGYKPEEIALFLGKYGGCPHIFPISFVSDSKNEISFFENKWKRNKGLLFIKSPFLNNNPSYSNIDLYLQRVKEIVSQEIPTITKGGFIVIQTQDVRIDGYIEPLAKKVVDMLTLDNLWLKEIVCVTQKEASLNTQHSRNYLKILHQYLLVYEVKK